MVRIPLVTDALRLVGALFVVCLALGTALCTSRADAQTTVLVDNYNAATGEFDLAIVGTAADVTLTLQAGQFDFCKPGGELGTVSTPTTPDLGATNNDGNLQPSFVIRAPVTTTCDVDPNTAYPGVTATVAGLTQVLAMGVAVTFGATPAPEPPVPEPPVAGSGTVTLTWIAPTTNTDGSPLTDLADYRVYWGLTPGPWSNYAMQSDETATSYTVTDLAVGVWYFAVTAWNAGGVESALSNVFSKTVEGEPEPPPPETNPCVLRPFEFTVRTWPGGITGSRSLSYTSTKAIDRFELGRTAARVTRVTATDLEGCVVTVSR